MKKLLVILFIGVVGFFAVGATNPEALANPRKLVYYTPCDTPLTYKIGEIDPRFGVSREQLRQDLVEAGSIWSEVYSKQLFAYSADGELTVNMVYDTRQSLNQQIGELEGKLEEDKSAVESQIAEFERRSAAFKAKVNELNKQIEYWNSQGGAPKEDYDKLKGQQQDLRREAEELNTMAKTLNQSTSEFNSQVSELNQTVTTFNQALQERPEQGLYKGYENEIDIYLTNSNQELIHTLAHELGHARGLDHVDTKNAIMYKSTNQVIVPSEEDIEELQFACRERAITEKVRVALQEFIYKYQATLKEKK